MKSVCECVCVGVGVCTRESSSHYHPEIRIPDLGYWLLWRGGNQSRGQFLFSIAVRTLGLSTPLPNLPAPVQAGQCRSGPGALWEAILCHSSTQHPSQTTSGEQQTGWGGAPVTATYPSTACPDSNPDALEPSRGSSASCSGVGVPSSLSQMCTKWSQLVCFEE